MKKTTMIIALIFTTVTIAGSALAWGPRGQKGGCNRGDVQNCQGFGNPAMTGLTQEQQDQLTQLRQDFFDQTARLRIDLVAKHKEMQILWQTSSPNKDELVSLTKEISALKGQVAEKRLDFMLEAKKIAPDFNAGPFGKRGKRGKQGKEAVLEKAANQNVR